MKKLIKNYTTEVPVERTISEIEKILIDNGAIGIAKEYEGGRTKAVFFKINYNGHVLPFKLPARTENAHNALRENGIRVSEEQAERVAWRATKTWIEAQITFINLDQAKFAEAFLPYFMADAESTLFESMKKNQFLLTGPKNE